MAQKLTAPQLQFPQNQHHYKKIASSANFNPSSFGITKLIFFILISTTFVLQNDNGGFEFHFTEFTSRINQIFHKEYLETESLQLFCESGRMESNENCITCPENGMCTDEGELICNLGFNQQRDECIPNALLIKTAMQDLKDLERILSRQYGDYQCNSQEHHQYWIYFANFSESLREKHQFLGDYQNEFRQSHEINGGQFTQDELILQIVEQIQTELYEDSSTGLALISDQHLNELINAKGNYLKISDYSLNSSDNITAESLSTIIILPREPSYSLYCATMLTVQDYITHLILSILSMLCLIQMYTSNRIRRLLAELSSHLYDELLKKLKQDSESADPMNQSRLSQGDIARHYMNMAHDNNVQQKFSHYFTFDEKTFNNMIWPAIEKVRAKNRRILTASSKQFGRQVTFWYLKR